MSQKKAGKYGLGIKEDHVKR
ncbi:hypothetical protein CP061683_1259A, partial [Chlamydia psittaci 06-1683]